MGGGGGPSTKKIKKQADYQYQLDQRAMQDQLNANRVSQNTPWGSVSWQQDPNTKQWTQNTTLNPADQQRLDQQRGLLTGLGGVANPLIGQVGQSISKGLDFSGLAQGPQGAPTGPQFGQVGAGPQFGQVGAGPQFGQVGAGPQFNTDFGTVDPERLARMGQAQFTGAGPGAQAGFTSAGAAQQAQAASAGAAQQAQAASAGAAQQALLGQLGNARQADFTSAGDAASFGGATSVVDRAREYDLQQKLDLANLAQMPEASEAVRQQTIDAMYQQALSRMQPMFEQQRREQLDRLYAMGGREGDPVFEQQKANLERQLTDANQQALWNAIGAGGQEQSRLFGLGMASRQQGFNEALQGGQFTNQALMNQFQQGLSNAQMANQVGMANAANQNQAGIASMNAQNQMNQFNAGQANNMAQFNAGLGSQYDLTRFGAENALNQFNAGQANQMNQFNAGNQQQANLANMQAANQMNQFNAGNQQQANLANMQAANQQNQFNAGQANQLGMFNAGQANDMGMFNAGQANNMAQFNAGQGVQGLLAGLNFNRQGTVLGNEAAQQGWQNQLAGTGFNNQALQQGWQNQLAGTGFNNQALQQGWENQLAGTGFNNQTMQQGFQNQIAANQQQQAIRDAQIQELLLQRGLPMQELSGILGMMGQVQNPQFGSYAQGQLNAPDYLGSWNNAQQLKAQQQQGMMSGLGALAGMAGTVMGGPIGGAIAGQMFKGATG